MRTIKFRGKRNHSEEWHYGHYTQGAFFHPASEEGTVRHLIHADMLYDVNPATVGQFTGLYDNDGKEIYEGDLIEVNGRLFGVVEWHKDGYFFINDTIVGVRNDGGEYSPIGEMVRYFSNHGHDFSVIGNIHDNPELLK